MHELTLTDSNVSQDMRMIPEICYNDYKRSQFQIKLVNYEARAHKPKADRAAGVKINMPCALGS